MTPQDIINQTNVYRASKGLKPLSVDSSLQKAAEQMGSDMKTKGYFSHTTPDGKDYISFIPNKNAYLKMGQNLAQDFPDATSTMAAWKASPAHNQNLIDDSFTRTGVAIVGNKVVQYFGLPQDTPAPKAIAKAPVKSAPIPIVAQGLKTAPNFSNIKIH